MLINKPTARTVNDVVAQIRANNTQIFNMMKLGVKRSHDLFWKDNQFTPEQISAAFGTNALELFQKSSELQALLKSIDPEYEILGVPEGYTATPNQDGTVTITSPE